MTDFNRIGIVGAGKMGCTLLRGLRLGAATQEVWAAVHTSESQARVEKEFSVPVTTDFTQELGGTDLLILSVRPRDIEAVCQVARASGRLPATTPVISVAAGVSIAALEAALCTDNPVIRAMPNTPTQIRQGMTVLCRGSRAADAHMEAARQIFQTIGGCVELSEAHMDAATAVSASGPAFVYLIIEALTDAAVRVGLPRDVAQNLVVQCVIGSGEMIRTTSRHPAVLRNEVMTPGGCTIAGVMTLEDGALRSILARAIVEATRVAASLGKGSVS